MHHNHDHDRAAMLRDLQLDVFTRLKAMGEYVEHLRNRVWVLLPGLLPRLFRQPYGDNSVHPGR